MSRAARAGVFLVVCSPFEVTTTRLRCLRTFGSLAFAVNPGEGVMRRLISLVVASCLAVAGVGAFLFLILFAQRFHGYVLVGSAFVGGLGLLWLWEDLKDWRSGS